MTYLSDDRPLLARWTAMDVRTGDAWQANQHGQLASCRGLGECGPTMGHRERYHRLGVNDEEREIHAHLNRKPCVPVARYLSRQ